LGLEWRVSLLLQNREQIAALIVCGRGENQRGTVGAKCAMAASMRSKPQNFSGLPLRLKVEARPFNGSVRHSAKNDNQGMYEKMIFKV